MSAASISKIHVTSSTGLSLNDRFTAFASRPETIMTNRRRSLTRKYNDVPDPQTSRSNERLLDQLARREKMNHALRLKRRSMKTIGGANYAALKRGSIKAFRVAANGRPIKTNTLTNIATMKADFVNNRGRPLRRSNSTSSIAKRLGARRPTVGGAAERVANRRMQTMRGRTPRALQQQQQPAGPIRRGRSRSRSRVRANTPNTNNMQRGRRSLSRGGSAGVGGNQRGAPIRSRSRSRSRARGGNNNNNNGVARALPIKARLGLRPANANARQQKTQVRRDGRSRSVQRRGVATGRVQKRRNSTAQQQNGAGGRVLQRAAGAGGRISRPRGRSASRNGRGGGRSQSRTRKGTAAVGQQQRSVGNVGRGTRRGRSQQRTGRGAGVAQRNGKPTNATNGGRAQQQQRGGRSRSRSRGGRGGRNLGRNDKPQVNKDALDQELDQYMATTKTENDMDFLLKN